MNMSTKNNKEEYIVQMLLEGIRDAPELVEFFEQFLTNLKKCDNRVLMCDAINSLFTEECFFTIKNCDMFKKIIKNIAPPKFIHDIEIPMDNLELDYGNILGRGGFGAVFLGKLTRDNQRKTVAVKAIQNPLLDIMSEIFAMSKLSHPNILPIIGFNFEKRLIITEYMENGNLHNVCFSLERPTTMQLFKYIHQVIKGLQHMHENKFIHRDISIRNIFINKDKTCKIGDLGLAVRVGETGQFKSLKKEVDCYHFAPEAYLKYTFSFATDIFSLGILILEVTHSPQTFNFSDEVARNLQFRFIKPERCPDVLYNIVRCSLVPDPNQRPSLNDFNNLFMEYLLHA